MKQILLALTFTLLTACGGSGNNNIFTHLDINRVVQASEIIPDHSIYIYDIEFNVIGSPSRVSYYLEYKTGWFLEDGSEYIVVDTSNSLGIPYDGINYHLRVAINDRSWLAKIWETSIIIKIEYPHKIETYRITE